MVLGHGWEWWLTQAAPGFGGLASAILIIYYAKLFKSNQEQTKATKASYAPSIDAKVEYGEDHIDLTLINRGQGVAKNIQFVIEVTVDEESTGYLVDFDVTLQPGQVIKYGDVGKTARLKPTVIDVTRGISSPHHQILLSDLLEKSESIYFSMRVGYTDILEERFYNEEIVGGGTKYRGENGLDSILINPYVYFPWATRPHQQITIFGPSHIDLKRRISIVYRRIKGSIVERKPNLFGEDHSRAKLYVGPACRYRLDVEAVEYQSQTEESTT